MARRNTPEVEPRALPDGLSAGTLCEFETRALLAGAGIASPDEALVQTPEEALQAAAHLGYPVVLKLQSPDVPHKTDAGVLALNLRNEEDLRAGWARIEAARLKNVPAARVRGVSVQPMARPGTEIIAGIIRDPEFGPMLMVGLGGIFVEILSDVQMAPAPISPETARRMLKQLAGHRILEGARGAAPRDTAALVDLLVRLSHFAVAAGPELREIEINPIFLHEEGQGLTIVDALAVIGAPEISHV